jgi:23S rRNA (uracil1939-C5)-methyltransferase
MRKPKNKFLNEVEVSGYAAEGKSLAKIDGKVYFIEGAVPGDVVDLMLTKNKKDWAEGKAVKFHKLSENRVEPFCKHFGICGGCKWQMLPYEKQLEYKQQEVVQNLRRIGKVDFPEIMPILGSDLTRYYRNKLEFTFSNRKYLTREEMNIFIEAEAGTAEKKDTPALGFHVPRIFDKIVDIQECYLQAEPVNQIRNWVRDFVLARQYSFYNIRAHEGWLRNLTFRLCTTGELMVNLVIGNEMKTDRILLLDEMIKAFPQITSLYYTINPKFNDSIHDLEPILYAGNAYVTEKLGHLYFRIGPKSFFQTNTKQAEKLYDVTKSFAGLTGRETVYDLYCGTGSIGLYVSDQSAKVIGVEVIDAAVIDARENAKANGINHAQFFSGDVINICTDTFFEQNGRPDVIITDPPRAGMHEKLVHKILEIGAPRVVYVSCNPATQARDLQLLDSNYQVTAFQPVDMFPHTHHIENVVQLTYRNL